MISAVIKYDDGRVSIHDSSTKEVGKQFSAGYYYATYDSNGRMVISESKLIELHKPYETDDNSTVIHVVNCFLKEGMRETINQLGFTHKLGVLLFGKQGTGKTSLMHYVANEMITNHRAVVLFCKETSSFNAAVALATGIREIQDNPIVFIADEFERYCKDSESGMKNLLDGNDSINNTLFLAATNYIEKIPDTIKDRPSRFKVVQEIKGIEDREVMVKIISDISNRISPSLFTREEIVKVVQNLDHPTMDDLKHICLDKATNNFILKGYERKRIGFEIGDKEEEVEEVKRSGTISWSTAFSSKPSTEPDKTSNI